MASVTKSVEIAAPQAEAFAVATDPARFQEWLTVHNGWPDGVPPSVEPGDTFRQGVKIMGMPADVGWTVEALEPGSKLVLRGAGPLSMALRTTITADGKTVSYEAGFFGGGVQGPMGDMVTQKAGVEIDASLARLKALVEGA